jgi:tetraacyldisaccharide 4'-kinase
VKRPWLAPLTPLYAAGLALRNLRLGTRFEPIQRLRRPVLSIGNLSTGGAGKTPLTIALAKALTQRGIQIDVLSRGYGRQSKLPARVLPDGSAETFGDEPLLIARETGVSVYVAAQRYQAGLMAESDSPDSKPLAVHLLDDGFQHRQLHRDIDILLLNRQDWHDSLLPAGNLREPIPAARRASVIAIPADDPAFADALNSWGWRGPIWRLKRTMEIPKIAGPVVAFCGIARPEQFFAGLEAAGLNLSAQIAFPDHHRYTPSDLKRLTTTAHSKAATALLTTEKDQVRIGTLATAFPRGLPLHTAHLRVEIENESAAVDWLINRLSPTPPHPPL